MRRVWDCFPFFNELDLLEARLTELDSVAYRHVLAESPVTHQGNPKPLYYAENKERFSAWQDKIIHVVADLPGGGTWDREGAQGEAIGRGLDGFWDDDILLVSDADEIPRAEVVTRLGVPVDHPAEPAGARTGYVLPMRHHQLAVNLVDLGWWNGTMASLGRPPGSVQSFRSSRMLPGTPVLRGRQGWIIDCGWHFSWLGGPDAVRAKARAYAHTERTAFIEEAADRLYRDKISPESGINRLLEVTIDESFPRYMRERRGPAAWYWPGAA
jgi:Glycosyltransferase family 17